MKLRALFEWDAATKFAFASGILGAAILSILHYLAILRSTNSTAAIGLLFIPFVALMAFAVFFIWGYSVAYLKLKRQDGHAFALKRKFAWGVAALLSVYGFVFFATGLALTFEVGKVLQLQTEPEILHVFENTLWKRNPFILAAVAQNPLTPSTLLDKMAMLKDPALEQPLASLFPVLGNNTKGFAVQRLVIMHPNIFPETIDYLARTSTSDFVLSSCASSPKTLKSTLQELEKKNLYLVDWGLAQNLNTPPEVFAALLERSPSASQRTTLDMISRNPLAPQPVRLKAAEKLKSSP
jgi:hypothetical protein